LLPCVKPVEVEVMVLPCAYVNETVIASSPDASKNPSVGPQTGEQADVVPDKIT